MRQRFNTAAQGIELRLALVLALAPFRSNEPLVFQPVKRRIEGGSSSSTFKISAKPLASRSVWVIFPTEEQDAIVVPLCIRPSSCTGNSEATL
jgi:hypothetical protein